MQEAAEGYEVFVSIVDAGSISAAARETDAPRETLSRQLARLEERLGVRLVHRGPRRLVLTPAGETLYTRARPLVVAAREAEAAVQRLDDTPRGLLRVSVPPGGGASFVAELALPFLDRHPEVRLELLATSRHVDLVAEGIDVALRAGTIRDPNLVARRLWSSQAIAVASPGYLDRRGRPASPADLPAHDCLLGMDGAERGHRAWPLFDGGEVAVSGRMVSNDLGVLLQAALADHGIALLPAPFAVDGLTAGALEQVLPDVLGTATSMAVVYVERALMPAKVRAFVDHVVAWFDDQGPEPLEAMLRAARSAGAAPSRPRESR